MENKMEIGKAIKKKIEGLDQNPSDQLWGKIEKDLNAKSKNKYLFWLFPLVVFLGFTTFIAYNLLTDQSINNIINEVQKGRVSDVKIDSSDDKFNQNTVNNKKSEVSINNEKGVNSDKKTFNKKIIIKNLSLKNNENQVDSILKPNINTNRNSKKFYKKTTRLVRSNSKYDEYEVTLKRKYFFKKYKNKINYSLARTSKKKTKKNSALKNYKKPRIFANVKNVAISATQSPAVKNNATNETDTVNISNNKSDIEVPTSTTTTTLVKKDIKIKPKKNVLSDSIQNIKSENIKFEIVLNPYFGPTYYNSFGKGNLITDLAANSIKKGLFTYNYGVYFRWMATKRFGLRLGFGKTDYNYSISTANNNDYIDFNTVDLVNYTEAQIYNDFASASTVNFTQKTSYVEVPLEAYFVIKDYRKFEIAATTGLSFLFLRDNNLTLKSDAVQERVIGTNKKTLEFGYTVNAGLVFGYKLTKKLNFDISPSFKYQFIEVIRDENFQPFSVNLQAGLSFKW